MRKLLSISHSYVVDVNRALPNAMHDCPNSSWEVTTIAPEKFHGQNDIRSLAFTRSNDISRTIAIPAYNTRHIHFFTYSRELRKIIRQGGYDLVHAWEEPYNLVGLQIALACRGIVPLVFRTAQSLPKRYPPPFNWIERFCVDEMAGWIFSGRLVEQNLLARPGYQERPRCMAPLGHDPELFHPEPEAGREVRSELGWDVGTPVVGFLGRVVEEKGVRVLMQAMDLVDPPWRLLIIGDGTLANEVRDWATTAVGDVAICSNVPHNDVARYINAMDLLVAPSLTMRNWKEQFGRMLVEAFACNVAVIGSSSGEIPNVIGDAGVVVPEQDPTALAGAISLLIRDVDARARFAHAGFLRASNNYTWPKIAEHTLRFFDSLLY